MPWWLPTTRHILLNLLSKLPPNFKANQLILPLSHNPQDFFVSQVTTTASYKTVITEAFNYPHSEDDDYTTGSHLIYHMPGMLDWAAGLSLANERQHYFVMMSLIGWVQA